ncbi:SagB/ThcOx family dehydrogenase [uncultured Desulfobacter sp.]|uniref:SagB/ThcOx family dehydrogenase n=1 Tax=uncultured Desulfobacter sp. TaxID=240139 RepID=UPI002AA78344|nr:SagB/ThcOx family dehydrogenase [uncultured Desulfobacter sp.]
MKDDKLKAHRYFLKDSIRKTIAFNFTDQNQGVPVPPIEKPYPEGATLTNLPGLDEWHMIPQTDLTHAIGNRKSHRVYLNQSLTLEELAYLLWCTQGVRGKRFQGHAYRNVPSAGCRHALETYLAVFNVDDLAPGVYRYLPLSHQLLFEFEDDMLSEKMITASLSQPYPGKSAVTFIWVAIPYRMEWRYGLAAHKVIALDAGHVCQNLYLACEAIDAGTCAIAAYDQEELDELLGLDGEGEFAIYLAPVGKVKKR